MACGNGNCPGASESKQCILGIRGRNNAPPLVPLGEIVPHC